MRSVLLCVMALVTGIAGLPASYVIANQDLLWRNYKVNFNKKYSASEEVLRKAVYVKNMLEASQLEIENPLAQFGDGPFSDLTEEEFKVYHSLSFPERDEIESPPLLSEIAATPVDWRTKGVVTQVKNQAQCGSCWSFSSTGGIEGQWAMAGNPLTSVSEQMLVSCDKNDSGCNGGLMDNAFRWLVSAHQGKIVTEASYPYTSGAGNSGVCKWTSSMPVGATIKGHRDIARSENTMATWVSTNGPLSIAVDAARGWQTYRSGIMTTCHGTSLDHGVLIVGFTADYWIVKNSWGPTWGENGFIRLQYGTNQCGIDKQASHPTV